MTKRQLGYTKKIKEGLWKMEKCTNGNLEIFDNMNDEEFERIKLYFFAHRRMYVDYETNPLAGELMNVISCGKVRKNVSRWMFYRILVSLFPNCISAELECLYIYSQLILCLVANIIKAPPEDPHFNGYKDLVQNILIPELQKEIQGAKDQKKCLDLLIRIYKISTCLNWSSMSQKPISLNLCAKYFVEMKKAIMNIANENNVFNHELQGHFSFFCMLLEEVIYNEDGLYFYKTNNNGANEGEKLQEEGK